MILVQKYIYADEIFWGSKSIANTKKDEDIIEEELYDCDDRMV